MQADDRVDVDRMRIRLLAHDLSVHLALRGNVDHELALDTRGAAKASSGRETSVGCVGELDLTHRREMRGSRDDRVLRVLALAHLDLAASADAAATADGVDIDAESSGGLEHGRSAREPASPAGRSEDDEMLGCAAPLASP